MIISSVQQNDSNVGVYVYTHLVTIRCWIQFFVVVVESQVTSNSLQLHGLQHARPPCPPPSPGVCPSSCVLNRWCRFNHLVLCCPFLLLPSIFPSIKGFSNEIGCCIRWPKYWHFNFSISPSNEYSGLISFRIEWFYLLTVKGFSRVFASTTVWKHSSLS